MEPLGSALLKEFTAAACDKKGRPSIQRLAIKKSRNVILSMLIILSYDQSIRN
jgi:hypothetical protein